MRDSSNSGFAGRSPQSAQSAHSAQSAVPFVVRRAADDEAASPTTQRHTFRRLRTRQRFLPLVVAMTVLMLLVVIATGYVAARANAISNAEASVKTNVQIAREVIGERGQYATLANNQLVTSSGENSGISYPLVNDTWVVDHVRQITGNQAVIYQLFDGPNPVLRSVSTNLPKMDAQGHVVANSRATGQSMPSGAQSTIFGKCGGHVDGGQSCYGEYVGSVTISGTNYVAAFMPLLDQNGALVGAVGVLTPEDAVLAAPKQLAIMLTSMGLLVGLIVLVVGTWMAGQVPNRLLGQLDGELDTMARAASELGRLAHQQQFRLQRQQRTAHQVGQYAMRLESLATAMDDGQSELHKTTTAIWEEMSQPGVAINLQTALRLAREAAVHASQVGMAGEETRQHARQVIALMNQVIAEGRALAHEGQEAESHARELAETLDHMETDLGEQLVPRRYDLGSAPLIRRITNASQRLRQLFQPEEESESASPTASPKVNPAPQPQPPFPRPGRLMTDARGRLPNPPSSSSPGRMPFPSFGGNDSLTGFPGRSETGFQSPPGPDVSGSRHGGRRPAGDSPASPGWVPPHNQLNDDKPSYGSSDSRWLND